MAMVKDGWRIVLERVSADYANGGNSAAGSGDDDGDAVDYDDGSSVCADGN